MITNATIASMKANAATRGDGAPVLGDELIIVPIGCELIDPSAHRVETDRQRGIRNDAMIRVPRAALDGQSIEPAVGMAVGYALSRLSADGSVRTASSARISDLREISAGMAIELVLAVRDDDAVTDEEGGA